MCSQLLRALITKRKGKAECYSKLLGTRRSLAWAEYERFPMSTRKLPGTRNAQRVGVITITTALIAKRKQKIGRSPVASVVV